MDSGVAQPLLLVVEAVGLHPAHGCWMGICHTYRDLRSGRVRDLRDGRITGEPGARVQIQ